MFYIGILRSQNPQEALRRREMEETDGEDDARSIRQHQTGPNDQTSIAGSEFTGVVLE